MKVFESNNIVTKYVFNFDNAIAEAVLYKYDNRIVICCSTQSGCRVGCKFCGTGEMFIRNLTYKEIESQIEQILQHKRLEVENSRFQIMFMSMGEPMHNWYNVKESIINLNSLYPNSELLISTIGINDYTAANDIISLSCVIKNIGIQFSIHKSTDLQRNILIPYVDKFNLKELRDWGVVWWMKTHRKVYLNYCIDGTNDTNQDFENISNMFSKEVFNLTFSVVCSKNETMKQAGYKNLEAIRNFEQRFINDGYNTRIFNPDGQDDIGGGCGQLWYFQKHEQTKTKGDE